MNDYVIFTDSACDINADRLAVWGVPYECLTFHFDDDSNDYANDDMDTKTFYNRMRTGGIAKTSAVNPSSFESAFDKILKDGKDILYLGFSSALSTTCNSAEIAAGELREKYPECKLIIVDTLSASVGQGLLIYLTLKKKRAGASIEDAAAYAESLRLKICHWFTVDDLVYLKRGGRISPTVAFVGNMIGFKPLLHVDNEGALCNISKVRGRSNSIAALADMYGKSALNPKEGTVFIGHGDCATDAKKLVELLKEKYGVSDFLISDVGPVIGAHTGPGILVICFEGNNR